jgi:hypothetical protein
MNCKHFVSFASRSIRSSHGKQLWNVRQTTTTTKEVGASPSKKTVTTTAPAAEGEATKQQTTKIEEPSNNPFPLLAHATENIDLSSRLRSYSNTFGIIGALMCSLSISALSMMPMERRPKKQNDADNNDETNKTLIKKGAGQPMLVTYLGLTRDQLEDLYITFWAASFYTSGVGLGLSTVVAGVVAATAPSYVKIFVRRHSDLLVALPICQAISGGFAGLGLFVGLDEARGEPVSWIGILGVYAWSVLLGGSTVRVLKDYKKARAAGKVSSSSNGSVKKKIDDTWHSF